MKTFEALTIETIVNLEKIETYTTPAGLIEVKSYKQIKTGFTSTGRNYKDSEPKGVIFLNGNRVAFCAGLTARKTVRHFELAARVEYLQNQIKAYQE